MESLNDYNARRLQQVRMFRTKPRSQLNDIACPNCRKELCDSCPGVTSKDDPPRTKVHCEHCNYKGFRIA